MFPPGPALRRPGAPAAPLVRRLRCGGPGGDAQQLPPAPHAADERRLRAQRGGDAAAVEATGGAWFWRLSGGWEVGWEVGLGAWLVGVVGISRRWVWGVGVVDLYGLLGVPCHKRVGIDGCEH